jgi:hypothetical protein
VRRLFRPAIGHNLALAVGLIVLTGLVVGVYWLKLDRELSDDFVPIDAWIIGFSTTDNDGGLPPFIAVSARSVTGAVGQRKVSPDRLRGCQIGDKIAASQRGTDLKLSPSPCREN